MKRRRITPRPAMSIRDARRRQIQPFRNAFGHGDSDFTMQIPTGTNMRSVDLMGSDPFIADIEAKTPPFFASATVSRGSDPIKSTASMRLSAYGVVRVRRTSHFPDAVTVDVVVQVPLPTTESTSPVAGFLVATSFPVYVTLAKTPFTFSFPVTL